ncbi:nucleoporin Nup37 [Lutzomyia longipalpis]|uniref:Putative nucleoporin nup37 n=1 Tax=Lutzomyia longipalpis TaxID=7200 RepID=A0A1B0CRL7_LUTLO|nr:nucleoporin Nup37 [Lutzomyia longipalpis]
MEHSAPSHFINFDDQISCFELSSHDWSQNLCCVALSNRIIVGIIRLPEEESQSGFEWQILKEIHHETRCYSLTISPETSLAVFPKNVVIAAAGGDFNIRIFQTDLEECHGVRMLKGHTSYINAVSWEPDGELLASTGDDYSCILWDCRNSFEIVTRFFLTAAGMCVKWHPEVKDKLMVAAKNGIISMYSVKSDQVILSIEAPKSPLMSADWSTKNRHCIAALAGGELFVWDLRKPSRPVNTKQLHEDGGLMVRISPANENLTASIGRPDLTLKVIHSKAQLPQITAPLKLFGGLGWLNRHVAAAYDRKLCLWNVLTK